MTPRDFCYWLQGYFEIQDDSGDFSDSTLNHKQVAAIRNHLNLVFEHTIDQQYGQTAEEQDHWQAIHDGETTTAKPGLLNNDFKPYPHHLFEPDEDGRVQKC